MKEFFRWLGEQIKEAMENTSVEAKPLPPVTIAGLHSRAALVLRVEGKPTDQESSMKRVPHLTWHGMMGRELQLFKYIVDGAPKYCEKVQVHTWNGQPEVFLAIADSDGNWLEETLWKEEEMDLRLCIIDRIIKH